MVNPNENTDLFENVYNKCHTYLKCVGILINRDNESPKTVILYKLFYLFNLSWAFPDLVAQMAFFVSGITNGESFTKLTNLTTCVLTCSIAFSQCIYFTLKMHIVRDLLKSILLQLSVSEQKNIDEETRVLKRHMDFVRLVINIVATIVIVGLMFFALTPFFKIILQYYSNEKINLTLPFLVLYPFDIHVFRNWVIAYIHVMWSGILQGFFFVAPYFLCYTCASAIVCLFDVLCQDIRILIFNTPKSRNSQYVDGSMKRLIAIAKRHKELIRCVDLMEEIYSFPNLLNVVSSSIIICLCAFNVMMITDVMMVLTFLQFLVLGLGQIFFICYYGDLIIRSSQNISDALYECQWYNADKRLVKNMLIMLIRAQKPCKLTAYGFSDINLNIYARILSTSTSYFALLRTVYLK